MYRNLKITYCLLFASLCMLGGLSATYNFIHSTQENFEDHCTYLEQDDRSPAFKNGITCQGTFYHKDVLVCRLVNENDHVEGKQSFGFHIFYSQGYKSNLLVHNGLQGKPKPNALSKEDLYLLCCLLLI